MNKKRSKQKLYLALAGLFSLFLFSMILTVMQPSPENEGTDSPIKSTTVKVQGKSVKTPSVFTTTRAEKNIDYSSPTFEAEHEFNAIAPEWKESGATESNRTVSIRTSKDGKDWSEWMEVHAMRPQKDDAPFNGQVFPETPIIAVGKFFQYRVELNQEDDTAPVIQDMGVTYIDSRLPKKRSFPSINSFISPKASATASNPRIISRTDWGSPDPDGNAFKGTDRYWYPTYQPTTQIFIHHTVTSDYQSTVDGASVVRAVWEYHANTRQWGDIGYNYLVDQSGNIYEGRAHGDNVTGGHVFEYNRGSAGVALLGCFHTPDSACKELNSSSNPPSSTMLDNLTTLLAWMTTRYEIDPQGQHIFCKYDGTGCLLLNTITGHRDAQSTACPGDLVLPILQSIRESTSQKKAGGFGYSAKRLSYSTVELGDNSQVSVTLGFKNTGQTTWYNTGANPVLLATANSRDHASAFAGSGWINNNRPALLNESSVAPGGTGTFTFNVANPPGYLWEWHEYFGLVAEGQQHFGNFIGIEIDTRSFYHSFVSQAAYTDSTKLTAISTDALSPGQTVWLVFKVLNDGNVTWGKTGTNTVRLGTDWPRDRNSRFCTPSWPSCNRPAGLQEVSVSPGFVGTFEFPILVPSEGGLHKEYFTPVVEGATWLDSIGMHYPLTVNNSYVWSFVGQTAYTDSSKITLVNLNELSPGQIIFFSVTAKNTGNTTWYSSGPYPARLGTSQPRDRASPFQAAGWIAPNRPAGLKEQSVAPSQNGTFEATYTVPALSGNFKEYLSPVVEGVTWLNDVGLHLAGNIKLDYKWSFISQAAYTDSTKVTPVDLDNLAPGQRFYFVVTAKNTGASTWYNAGSYPLRLGASNPKDRSSLLFDSSWLSSNRTAPLTEALVAPNETGNFATYYTAPETTGTYKEYFQPVAENLTWLNDLGLHIPFQVR